MMFDDSEVEKLLDVDADEEFSVYLLAAGVPDDIESVQQTRVAPPG